MRQTLLYASTRNREADDKRDAKILAFTDKNIRVLSHKELTQGAERGTLRVKVSFFLVLSFNLSSSSLRLLVVSPGFNDEAGIFLARFREFGRSRGRSGT